MPTFVSLQDFLKKDFRHHSSRVVLGWPNSDKTYLVTALPSTMSFGTVNLNKTSTVQKAEVKNTGNVDVPILAIRIAGSSDYAVSWDAPAVLSAGESFDISVLFTPQTIGSLSGGVYVDYGLSIAPLTKFIEFFGYGVAAESTVSLSISDGVYEESDDDLDDAVVLIDSTSLVFGSTTIGESSDPLTVTLSNTSTVAVSITALSTTGDYSITSGSIGDIIAANGTKDIEVTFAPTLEGTRTGLLTIVTNAGEGSFAVNLSGTGEAAAVVPLTTRLAISGTEIVEADTPTTVVRLKSINWFGMEGTNYTPHGTWLVSWKSIIDDIKSMGFNCIRFPFSGDTTTAGRTPPGTAIDATANPDLVGLTSLEILDLYLDYCAEVGIYVVLDHHRRTAGDGADGAPTDDSYTQSDWEASWAVMTARYANHIAVVGADLHNEPHSLTWSDWADAAEACAETILAAAPDWLIFIEGVGSSDDSSDSYWWGGYLKGVATRPISLSVADKVIYSPHEYGQSVGTQSWLAYADTGQPTDWPNNLPAVWDEYWGFIVTEDIAPIWIGEFGGKFGVDGSGASGQPYATYEVQWVDQLIDYLNLNDMSFAYWAYNPNSTDTGGLVQDDWVTHQTVKLALLEPLLDYEVGSVILLVDDDGTQIVDDDDEPMEAT